MILRAILLLMFLASGGAALAQTVTVRSGEHAGFSRLVFEGPADVAWALGRGPEGYLLDFDGPGLEIGFDRVFDLIPRTRLTGIGLDGSGRVALAVADGVHAEAFTLRPGIVVLDLRDGPPPDGSPFEAPLVADVPSPAEAPERALPPPTPTVRLPLDLGRRAPLPVIGRFIPPDPPASLDPPDPRVAEARSELMKQIGRAAAQGLLEPADLPRDPESPVADHAAIAVDPPPDPALPGLGERPNMHVETSVDRGLGPQASGDTRSALGDPCYPDEYFDLASWFGAGQPAALIAERRSALLNMRDAPDPAGAENLVRAYLALGFGAEARAVIDTVALDTRPAPVWRELGAILDEGHAATPDLFAGQLSCPSRAALWATLAQPELPPRAEIDEAAVIRSFSELPLHLRRHLGPILADRFLAAEDTAAAARVRNAVARVGELTRSGDLSVVEARIDLSHGETDRAEARIKEVLSDGGLASPDALVLQLETTIAAGEVPDADALALAEALAFERRGTPVGTRLLKLAIRGHAARKTFETAFGMLVDHDLDGDAGLLSDLVIALARGGSDADVLREVYSGVLAGPSPGLSYAARLALADRLLTLGFAERAADVIAPVPALGSPEERLVRARLALASRQPGQAIQYLAGLETPVADGLRAEAARALGDLSAAARFYAEAGETGKQAALAWQIRDWSTVREAGPDTRSGYATLRDETPAAAFDPGTAPSLAGARSLLEGSSAMRDRLKEILAAPQTP